LKPAARGRSGGRGRPNKSKQDQANPNKSKQKGLDLLGFIRPNRDFSMGYGRKNKKKVFLLSPHWAKRLKRVPHSVPARRARPGRNRPFRPLDRHIAADSVFVNQLLFF
jgi:hypothetical protein